MSGWDLFESGADTIVIPTNEVGVMGAGLAKEARTRWPDVARAYSLACAEGQHTPGEPLHVPVVPGAGAGTYALLTPTKDHWRNKSSLQRVYACLLGIESIMKCKQDEGRLWAIPALGCGLGGLDERLVSSLLAEVLAPHLGRIIAPWAGLTHPARRAAGKGGWGVWGVWA